jgi:hypothetical protein
MGSTEEHRALKLKLIFLEGSECGPVIGTVVKRGIKGARGKGLYWILKVPPTRFVKSRPPACYVILGPAFREHPLEMLDRGHFISIACQMMLDQTGLAPDIDSFDFPSAYDFGRGIAELVEVEGQ